MEKVYATHHARLRLLVRPEKVQWTREGEKVIVEQPKYIKFEGGIFRTSDPEEIEFIENHTDFTRTHIIVDALRDQNREELEDPAKRKEIPKLKKSMLQKFNKEELVHYAKTISHELPWDEEKIADRKGGVTKDMILEELTK